MSLSTTMAEINVSLEEHLQDTLKAVHSILPDELEQTVKGYISEPSSSTHIPYSILLKISQWARTDEGLEKLEETNVDANAYSIISLLAGTVTSPERKFGDYIPPKEPEVLEAERRRERKAITALANGVLSVGGIGVGAYWASDKLGWKGEWRVLLALFAAVVVAISEAGLFIIWQWQGSKVATPKSRKRCIARHKKVDPPTETPGQNSEGLKVNKADNIRQRQQLSSTRSN